MTEREALKLALEALEVATTPLAKDRQEVLRARDAIREALAQPEQEPVVQWHLSKDGLPPVGSEVVGGYFYKDTWLKGEPEVFAWGQCRVIKDDHPDFPDGKRWITFGPSHNQITYWCWPPKKPGDTSPPQPEQSQVEETLRYEIDALETKLAECRAQQEHVATSDTSEKRVDEMAKQLHEPEPVIDKSAAIRIATALGWTPQRTWVGLTDEEQQELYNAWMQKGDGWGSFYTLIEAKLRSKNT